MKEDDYNKACREILEKVLTGEIKNESQLNKAKKDVSKHYHLASLPRNGDIIIQGSPEEQAIIKGFLRRKTCKNDFRCCGNCCNDLPCSMPTRGMSTLSWRS